MSTIVQDVFPGPFTLPTTAYAAPDVLPGTNFGVSVLRFDATTDESAAFLFRAHNYGSGSLSVDIEWYADTATSGDIVWTAALAAITPDADATDIETKSLGTAATVTDTHLGTTGQRLHRCTIAVSSLDALVAGDWCVIRLTRDADVAGDTMTGDALLARVMVSYSDV